MAWHQKLQHQVIARINRAMLRLRYKSAYILSNNTRSRATHQEQPTIFHITHHKAGSQWVAEVLKYCVAPERIVLPQPSVAHFLPDNLRPGGVYLTIYNARPRFETITKSFRHPMHKIVVIRDLRDTLVSLYFSLRYSHPVMDIVGYARVRLAQMCEEEGLLYLLGAEAMQHMPRGQMLGATWDDQTERDLLDWTSRIARIQRSWIGAEDQLLIRYEELVADEYNVFQRIMDYCQIEVEPEYLRQVVKNNSFEARTGRKAGEEDIMIHQRKGIVGDWRNYFTDRVKAEFKARFNDVLIETGYEKNSDW
jgi:hypothetical protein